MDIEDLKKENHSLKEQIAGMTDSIHELKKSRDMYQSLIELMPQRLLRKNRSGQIVFANRAYLEELGLSLEEALGKDDEDLYPRHFVEVCEDGDALVLNLGEIVDIEEKHWLRKEGRAIDVQVVKAPYQNEQGEIAGVQAIFWDISDRKEAEREVIKLRNHLLNILESMPSILVGIDEQLRVTLWNRAAADLTGVKAEDAAGQFFRDLFPYLEPLMEKIEKSLKSREIQNFRKLKRYGGEAEIYEDITIYPLSTDEFFGAAIRIDDVTEKIRLEEMIIQSEKMRSLGSLAAGIAHEINNPLAGLVQSAGVIRNRLLSPDVPRNRDMANKLGLDLKRFGEYLEKRDIVNLLNNIRQSGERISKIVGNMLGFARKSGTCFTLQNPRDIVENTLELASSEFNVQTRYDFKKIRIEKNYGKNIPDIECDRSEIQQVLLNLLNNAAHALIDSKSADPTISINLDVSSSDSMICLSLKDNGPGISEAVRKRIFEPFFTTKPAGVGTGLGLSVSFFIIKDIHGGELSVDSAQGMGTVFNIKLPLKRSETN